MFKKQDFYLCLLYVFTLLASCASSKKILDENVEPQKRYLGYTIKSNKSGEILHFYIVDSAQRQHIQYYFYKNNCSYMEKRVAAGSFIIGQKAKFTNYTFLQNDKPSIDLNLSSDDKVVLQKAKSFFDSLNWCRSFDPNLVTGLKIVSAN